MILLNIRFYDKINIKTHVMFLFYYCFIHDFVNSSIFAVINARIHSNSGYV